MSTDSSSSDEDFLDLLSEACDEVDQDSSASALSLREPEPEPEPELSAQQWKLYHTQLEPESQITEETDAERIAATLSWIDQLSGQPGGPQASFHGVELRSIPGRGAGIIAEKDLPVGHAAIMLGRALTVSHQRAMEWSKAHNDIGSILDQMKVPVTTCIAIFLICERCAPQFFSRLLSHYLSVLSQFSTYFSHFLSPFSHISLIFSQGGGVRAGRRAAGR